ncbi:hypothetical protein UVI_02011850 [Ustilaginoidea virens]|uniref:FAD dependent oxidoreductase domain-containing protein n=1 Tax=Ustilaginoidea virens TaxID=1159556 RepID=A0A1B5L368_USTVR|nr:hypothetical protein UVI_02011850 [Ustilaginoidea virens]
MEEKRNIVIIGGGVVGCTTAYYLTRHPRFNPACHSITLLEAGPTVAGGASGKAGGLLALWAYPASLVPLSYRLHAELAAKHNGAQRWGYRNLQCGSLEADGAAKELLAEAILPRELDWVDRDIITSWAEMGDPGTTETSQVHPFQFTTSIGELAQEAGVRIKTNAKVTKIATSKTRLEKVEYLDRNTGETVELTDMTDVVVTAGPWTGRLLPRAKVEGLRAHSVVFELPHDFVPEHRAKLGQKRLHRSRVDPEIYARPFGEAYACGEPDSSVPLPDTVDQVQCDEAQCDDIISYIKTFSPVLGSAPIKAKQSCYLPRHMRFGQESGPLIGPTTVPGVWVAAGHTCWGIQNGPATGKLMSEYIFDGAPLSANVDKFDPRKFKV